MASIICRIQIDTQRLQQQADELAAAISALDGVRRSAALEAVEQYLPDLSGDVVGGHCVSTALADGSHKVLQPLWLGGKFEGLLAAIRAGEEARRV